MSKKKPARRVRKPEPFRSEMAWGQMSCHVNAYGRRKVFVSEYPRLVLPTVSRIRRAAAWLTRAAAWVQDAPKKGGR